MGILQGKVAIVTGGSRGIGAAIAIGLAREGAKIVLVSRSVPGAELMASFEHIGSPYIHCQADLGEMRNIRPTVETALAPFGVSIFLSTAPASFAAPHFWTTRNRSGMRC